MSEDLDNLQKTLKPFSIALLAIVIIIMIGLSSSMYDEAVETNPGEVLDIPDFLEEELMEESRESDGGESEEIGEGEEETGTEEDKGTPEEELPVEQLPDGERGGGGGEIYSYITILIIAIILLLTTLIIYYYYKNYYKKEETKDNKEKYEVFINNSDNKIEEIYGELIKDNNIEISKSPEETKDILKEEYNNEIIEKIINKFVKSKYSGEEVSDEEIEEVIEHYEKLN